MTDETLLVLGAAVSFIFLCGCYLAVRQSLSEGETLAQAASTRSQISELPPDQIPSLERDDP